MRKCDLTRLIPPPPPYMCLDTEMRPDALYDMQKCYETDRFEMNVAISLSILVLYFYVRHGKYLETVRPLSYFDCDAEATLF